jgi:hypothetical protein
LRRAVFWAAVAFFAVVVFFAVALGFAGGRFRAAVTADPDVVSNANIRRIGEITRARVFISDSGLSFSNRKNCGKL